MGLYLTACVPKVTTYVAQFSSLRFSLIFLLNFAHGAYKQMDPSNFYKMKSLPYGHFTAPKEVAVSAKAHFCVPVTNETPTIDGLRIK